MGDTLEYLVYAVNVRSRKDISRISYVSFGDVCSEIEFTEARSSKLVISLSRVDILMIKVEYMLRVMWLSFLIIILCACKVIQVARRKIKVITKCKVFLMWSYNN